MLPQMVLKKTMQLKSDEELYLALYVHSQDYTPEAIKAAREEFSRRQLNEQTMRSHVKAESISSAQGGGQHRPPAGRDTSSAPIETFWDALWATTETHKTSAGWGCILLGCRWLAVLIVVWCLANAADTWLDSIGWTTHDHDTPVWIHGDWMVGEYRVCGMRTTTPFAGIVPSQGAQAELPRLFCGKNWADEGVSEFEIAMPDPDLAVSGILGKGDWEALDSSFHTLPVIYHGRISRPDAVFVSWRCQRLTESLRCNALN